MLISLNNLKGYSIVTSDGSRTEVNDVLFDSRDMKKPYLLSIVKNQEGIHNMFAMKIFNTQDILMIHQNDPQILVTRAQESKVFPTQTVYPIDPAEDSIDTNGILEREFSIGSGLDHTVFSLEELLGIKVYGRDGHVGHLIDFIVDDNNWDMRFLAVDTESFWYPSNKSIIPISSVKKSDWKGRRIMVDLRNKTIQECPDYIHDRALIPDISSAVHSIIISEST